MSRTRTLRLVRRDATACATGVGVFWGGYLNLVGVAAERSLRRGSAGGTASNSTRFRVLVPAHDEEELIAATLDSLRALDYPSELVEVHVVADNCHDRTAAIARAAGVHVHERDDANEPGKGAALAWLIDRLPPGGHDDAVVVIDADTIADPGLLSAFDRTFGTGAPAIQGYYTVRAAETGGDVGFRAVALAVRHFVRPAGRTALGGSSSLHGNGMAFRDPIARAYRWSNGLTEDLDMGLRLLLAGHHVAFAPDAVVEAEMPGSLEGAITQNERWEAGRIAVARDHLPGLLRAARQGAHGRRWPYLDAAIDISLPPLTTVIAGTAAAGTGLILLSTGRTRRFGAAWAALAVGSQGLHVLHALRLADVSPEARRSLRRTPAHIAWKSGILTRVARQGPGTWIRTARTPTTTAA